MILHKKRLDETPATFASLFIVTSLFDNVLSRSTMLAPEDIPEHLGPATQAALAWINVRARSKLFLDRYDRCG